VAQLRSQRRWTAVSVLQCGQTIPSTASSKACWSVVIELMSSASHENKMTPAYSRDTVIPVLQSYATANKRASFEIEIYLHVKYKPQSCADLKSLKRNTPVAVI